MLKGKHILVGVTGGIAAYKAAVLVRLLVKQGAEVRVIMTPMAQSFITPLTMATLSQHPVFVDMFDPTNGDWNSHVSLGTWADIYIIAPATANTIAKFVHGQADNLLCTTYLSARCPVLLAPAMDLDMYAHPATQANLKELSARAILVEPEEGFLASGLEGKGRMAEPEAIAQVAAAYFRSKTMSLAGKRVLVTSGPTREPLDPVRFLTNRSSGIMGTAICNALADMGAEVYCITGPCEHQPPPRANLKLINVETAQQMHDESIALWPTMHAGVMAAAVADYRPIDPKTEKIRHRDESISLTLESCPDIAKAIGTTKQAGQILVGFALETDAGESSAMRKLERKNLDLCILNSLQDAGAGFCASTNKTTFYYRSGETEARPLESKAALGEHIAGCLNKLLTA